MTVIRLVPPREGCRLPLFIGLLHLSYSCVRRMDRRSRYELALSVTVIEAPRTAVGEQLPRHLPALQELPPEIRQLIARLAAERRVVASLPLQLPLPRATPPRS